MRVYIGKKCEQSLYISILNCHPENKFKIEAFWFVLKSFCLIKITYQIFINLKKMVVGETEKSQTIDLERLFAMISTSN